jgi:hypothetical protein
MSNNPVLEAFIAGVLFGLLICLLDKWSKGEN